MKLVHQINLAFGAVILLVLSVSAVIIHYVLLDHFIGAKQEEMQTVGQAMTATLSQAPKVSALPLGEAVTATKAVPASTVRAIISDKTGKIILGSPPDLQENGKSTPAKASGPGTAAGTSVNLTNIWEGKDKRFLVAVSSIPQGTLTLLSPVSRIKEIEQSLLKQMILVLALVGALMFLLSLLITRKLIKPLMSLREELKKVKSRKFGQVQFIKAGGELGSVSAAVYELAGELNRYTHAQKQFFQNASHELKTPLMSISGYAEGIRDGVFEGGSVQKGLNVIISESARLKNIVTEMTLLAKLDSEEDIFHPVEVNLEHILTDTVERVNPILVSKGLKLHINYASEACRKLTVMADQDKLLQALLNVVLNAARHARSEIRIRVALVKDQVEIDVTDDGPGIAPEMLPFLFHRFVKGKDGDTGLGLAISRAIVERNGGKITAANNTQGGAVISFRFPVFNGIEVL